MKCEFYKFSVVQGLQNLDCFERLITSLNVTILSSLADFYIRLRLVRCALSLLNM